MKLISTGLFVDDQEKAIKFYRDILGFVVKQDIPVGEFSWITLVSPEEKGGTELILEPNVHPAAREYQSKIYADGIPANMFGVEDIDKVYEELKAKGVAFTMNPTDMDGYKLAVFDDTCGNLIQILED